MKKTVIRYGLISTGVLMFINLTTIAIFGTEPANYEISEVIGYAAIIGSLILVIFGMREFEFQNSPTSFMKKIGIGTGISLFPSLAFGIYDVIYFKWIDTNGMENYREHTLNKMEESMSPEEFEAAKAETLEQLALFDNLFFQFALMFMTVFVIGLIISLLSAMYFQVKPVRN